MDDDQLERAFYGQQETPEEMSSFSSFVNGIASTAASTVSQNLDNLVILLNEGMKGLTVSEQISEQRKNNKREAEKEVEKLSEDRQKRPTYLDWLNAPSFWFAYQHGQEEDQAARENRFRQLHWWIDDSEQDSKQEQSSRPPARDDDVVKLPLLESDIFRQNVFTIHPNEAGLTSTSVGMGKQTVQKTTKPPFAKSPSASDKKKKLAVAAPEVIELDDSDEEKQEEPIQKIEEKVHKTAPKEVIGEIASMRSDSSARVEAMRKRAEAMKLEHQMYIQELKDEGRVSADGSGKTKDKAGFRYLVPSSPLSDEEEQLLVDKFGSGRKDDVVCERFEAQITKHCFQTADPGRWVNDEIVNAYLRLCERRGVSQPDSPYLFSSFFLTSLVRPKLGYNYPDVQRWTARGKGKADIFSRRAVIYPVNIGNTHWVLVCVDIKFKTITYYDSMGGDGRSVLETILRYLKDEHQAKKGAPLPEGWELVSPRKAVPQQNNCNDCGIFTCMFGNTLMEYFLREPNERAPNSIFSFSMKDMDRIRQQIQLDIIHDQVYPS